MVLSLMIVKLGSEKTSDVQVLYITLAEVLYITLAEVLYITLAEVLYITLAHNAS